jgi:hypothetical protein
MANVLKHRFPSAKADGADATQIQPSHWNDGHAFSGGNAGDVLTRDPTDASYGAQWQALPIPPEPTTTVITANKGIDTSTVPVFLDTVAFPAGYLLWPEHLIEVIVSGVVVGTVPGPVTLDLYADHGLGGNPLITLTGATGVGDLGSGAVFQAQVIIKGIPSDNRYVSITGVGGVTSGLEQKRTHTVSALANIEIGWAGAWNLRYRQITGMAAGSSLHWAFNVSRRF